MEIDSKALEGNAFSIMGHVQKLLQMTGRESEVEDAMNRMQSGNYDNLCDVAEEVTFGSIVVTNRD